MKPLVYVPDSNNEGVRCRPEMGRYCLRQRLPPNKMVRHKSAHPPMPTTALPSSAAAEMDNMDADPRHDFVVVVKEYGRWGHFP